MRPAPNFHLLIIAASRFGAKFSMAACSPRGDKLEYHMPNDFEAELKRVEGRSKAHPEKLRRDSTMTGGERGETPAEKSGRKKRARKPKQPPIMQRTA